MDFKLIAHIILGVLFFVFFLYRFVKDKQVYQFIFLLWIPTTYIPYFTDNKNIILGVSAVQVLMFILVIFFLFRRKRSALENTVDVLEKIKEDSKITDEPIKSENNSEENK